MGFVQLHNHTCKGSVRDAISRPEDIIKKVKELGQVAVAFTDHGSTSALMTGYKLCQKLGLKFIFGEEFYITQDIRIKERGDYRHICLWAKDLTGYKNILKLTTKAYKEGFYYKPRIDWKMLREHLDGLIIGSACMGGLLGITKADGTWDEMEIYHELERCKNDFGDNFYCEIHTNQMPEQIALNKLLYQICIDMGIQCIATCDAHYVNKEDAWVHRYWNGIDDNDENGYYQTDDFYLHSEEEVRKDLSYLPKEFVDSCIDNTQKLADRCNVEITFGEDNFPYFPTPNGQLEYVKEICRQGWRNKIIGKVPKDKWQVYVDRLNEEFETLEKANYLNMLLIVWEYMHWGQQQGIRFGVGRGSVGGSLVAYLMDITKVDPIEHGLYFSRFCNLERVTTADIDVDVMQARRQEVIDHLRDVYGHVYQVRTFMEMSEKSALQKAGMCLKVPPSTIRALSKQMGDGGFEQLKAGKENEKLIKLAKAFVGIISSTSVHASAVLVFPKDPTEFCAIEKQGDNEVAAYDYHELEELGLAKVDVLGLKNMDIIQDTLDLLKKRGVELDLNDIPLDDKKTSDLLCGGHTAGVFQCESEIYRGIIAGIQPHSFKDLVPVVALGRPAPMQNGSVDEYIKRRREWLKRDKKLQTQLKP